MINFTKSKIHKYKKEILWLMREKYKLEISAEESSINSWILPPRRARDKDDEREKILEDIKRILNGEPIDYVIGFKEFLNCKIDLAKKPLIPRVETEFWVENQISQICKINKLNLKILDLCCGSGCIGISILKQIDNCNVTFVDISDKALKQTSINLQINNLQFSNNLQIHSSKSREKSKNKNYKIIKSNLFSNLTGQKFDYIFTNPPYVINKYIKGSLIYEPKIALDGKKDGLEIIYKILSELSLYLNPNGKLFLEFGYGQKLKIEKKIKQLGYKNYRFYKDQFNKYRNLEILFN